MDRLKIFLFTCVKDGRQFIGKLFDSLLKQTNTDFVHFIYDNGSTDTIDDLVEEYKQKVSLLKNPFKVVYEKTSESVGLNMATKYCIDKCDKEYFIWIDCDNWVHKDFFKYLIKSIKKNPSCMIYRTYLVKVDEDSGKMSSNYYERRLSISSQNNAAFTFFTRKNRYYYSFFAVNRKQYLEISKNNILDIRDYYNDEQILSYCYLSKGKTIMIKKSIGYYLARNNSEAHLIKPKQEANQLFAFDIRKTLAKTISENALNYYLAIKKMFDEYNNMQAAYAIKRYDESRAHFKALQQLSNINRFSLNVTFRNKDYFYWFFVLFIKTRIKK